MDPGTATVGREQPELRRPPSMAGDTRQRTPRVAAPEPAALFEVMSTTRAIRHLAADPVPEDTIRALIQAAVWAPTGGNQQGQAFVVVTDREQIARLATVWRRVVDDFRAGLAAAGVQPDDPTSQRVAAAVDYQRDHFEQTPLVIVACYDLGPRKHAATSPRVVLSLLRAVGISRWRRLVRTWPGFTARSQAASIFPGVENLLLAARAHGLGACLTTWHLLAENEVKEILAIPRDVDTFAVIPIGWPLRSHGPVRRGPIEDVIHRDRW